MLKLRLSILRPDSNRITFKKNFLKGLKTNRRELYDRRASKNALISQEMTD